MTKLGYSKKEIRRAYLSEFINKYRTYKKLFNFEKCSIYADDSPKEVDSMRML